MAAIGSQPVDNGSLVVGASALFVVVGGFIGWFTVPIGETLGSIQGVSLFSASSPIFNGLVTILLATVVTILSLFLPANDGVNVTTAIGGLAIELIAVTFVVAPEVALAPAIVEGVEGALPSTGLGVYLTLVGGLGIILGAYMSYRD